MVSVAILAGGQSKRMGRDKAFLKVGGCPVIERVLAQVGPLTDDLFISANSPEKYAHLRLPIMPDIYPDKAALGGLYSVIRAARHNNVLVVACDMPFLNAALLQYMIDLAPTADVIVPLISPPQPETLHAIYSKNCLPAIERRLLANQLRLIGFFDDVSVRYVERAEIASFDPEFRSFTNMNTPEEWQKVEAIAQALEGE
ncbi:MAG: molybdenum cofactor guanylyltransferase [Chloroflexi bacterium]|nr:molybdenum cofactor guanylyltransferase [Chloroflexota bacterium]